MKIKSKTLLTYRTIHTWTGIICGLFLFIAFYAGAISVFKETINEWATPPLENIDRVEPLSEIAPTLTKLINVNTDAADKVYLNLNTDDGKTHQIYWSVQPEDADELDNSGNQFFTAYTQHDELIVEEIQPARIGKFIDVLHRVVGLPVETEANHIFMGTIAGLYFLALFSGLVIILPVLVRSLFAFRVKGKPKRVWLDAHNVVGVFSFPFHIVIALTSFIFAYHDLIYGMQDKVIHEGGLRTAFFSELPKPDENQSVDPAMMVVPDKLLAIAQAESIHFQPYMMEYVAVTTPRAMVRVWGRDEGAIAPRFPGGFVTMNPYTGEVLTTEYTQRLQSTEAATVSSFFALHFATYGGDMIKWIYLILGLSGAWLFYSGNLLWVETRRRRQKKNQNAEQRKDVKLMASLTVGVCLGCIIGVSSIMAATKWLQIYTENHYIWLQSLYYVTFFSSIIWAFWRGAALASVELLKAAIVITLLVPLTSLTVLLIPSFGLWAHTDITVIAVDLTTLGLAASFWVIMRGTSKRVYHSREEDSVWSYA